MNKFIKICVVALFIITAFFFFTNDYGLVDLQKTSVVLGVGIDVEENGVQVTAQIAVPLPSENGDSVQYAEVSGRGASVADALSEINAKSGFYPKLLFCNLVILGESCKNAKLFETLDYFYRNEYAQLTAQVAMCKGRASDLFSLRTAIGNMNTLTFERIMSDEAKKSGNAAAVSLKDIALMQYSKSNCCYMPYITFEPKASENGQGTDSSSTESNSSTNKSSSGTGQNDNSAVPVEFTCNQTVLFKDGEYRGTLDKRQTLMLNVLKGKVRRIITCVECDGISYSVGIKNNSAGIKATLTNGNCRAILSYKGRAQIQDAKKQGDPKDSAHSDVLSSELLASVDASLRRDISSLVEYLKNVDCDVLEIENRLYKFAYDDYSNVSNFGIGDMQVKIDVNVISVN